jgi:hypothetical protein
MSIFTFQPLTSSEIDTILSLNAQVIEDASLNLEGKKRLLLVIPDILLEKISNVFGISLTSPLPAQLVKGDTPLHTDHGPSEFDYTYLMYLTDSQGSLVLEDTSFPITKGSAFQFSEGISHGTVDTENTIRFSIGPFNEFQQYVGINGFQYYIYDEFPGDFVVGLFDNFTSPYVILDYPDVGDGNTPIVPPGQQFVGWSLDPSGNTLDYTAGQTISLSANYYELYPVFEDIPPSSSPSTNSCLAACGNFGGNVQAQNRSAKDKIEFTNNKALYVGQERNLNNFGQPRQFSDYASYLRNVVGRSQINSKRYGQQ